MPAEMPSCPNSSTMPAEMPTQKQVKALAIIKTKRRQGASCTSKATPPSSLQNLSWMQKNLPHPLPSLYIPLIISDWKRASLSVFPCCYQEIARNGPLVV
ncbi:rCG40964 [Rattus norvegicus]|uniref:RCG40964 n=1 Tax=Rattus norvegicus TaxID=10116 RepID=A6KMQ7_RAT|nr:rCG40964 [Rattus norvegicus]